MPLRLKIFRGNIITRTQSKYIFRGDLILQIIPFNRENAKIFFLRKCLCKLYQKSEKMLQSNHDVEIYTKLIYDKHCMPELQNKKPH